jgi:hypothetical protein
MVDSVVASDDLVELVGVARRFSVVVAVAVADTNFAWVVD